MFFEKHVYTKFRLDCVSELHAHVYPYHNVWPEAFFFVLQEVDCLLNCLHVSIISCFYHFTRFRCSIHVPSGF